MGVFFWGKTRFRRVNSTVERWSVSRCASCSTFCDVGDGERDERSLQIEAFFFVFRVGAHLLLPPYIFLLVFSHHPLITSSSHHSTNRIGEGDLRFPLNTRSWTKNMAYHVVRHFLFWLAQNSICFMCVIHLVGLAVYSIHRWRTHHKTNKKSQVGVRKHVWIHNGSIIVPMEIIPLCRDDEYHRTWHRIVVLPSKILILFGNSEIQRTGPSFLSYLLMTYVV